MSRLRPALLLASAALIAGCGSSGENGSPAGQAPAPRAAQPAPGGQLRVGITAGGIGTATTGSPRGGIEVLPDTPVRGGSNTEQGVGAGASCANADLMPTAGNLSDVQVATLCLLNGERADAGLRPLSQNAALAKAALVQSKAMVADQFFDHLGKDGSDPVSRIRKAGYIPAVGTWTVGENLAWGTGTLSTPKGVVGAWMKSQGHRENILRPTFKEIGFGIVAGNPRSRSGDGATYATTFGVVSTPAAKKKPRGRKARTSKSKARASRKPIARISTPRGG
jgi:uncharacterized protein YkwD